MADRPRFVAVGAGRLALWHRPPRRAVPRLPEAGCTRVVTLLSEREGAREIGELVAAAGMRWSWIPMASGRPPEGRQNHPIRAALPELSRALDEGESLLLHCSAGMHRTGMIAFALLRWRGIDEGAARTILSELRETTGAALTERMVAWAQAVTGGDRGDLVV